MAWGTKIITRKFLKYAQEYVGWATFADVSRPVPNVPAVRIAAPFFDDEEVFLNGSMWWVADPYDPTSRFNVAPRPLCPLDAYEADVAVAIARVYLTALALQIGTKNENLVPAAFQRGMTEIDEHLLARREAFMVVMRYLALVAEGVAHREKRTQKLALQLFEEAEPTLREIQESRAAVTPPPPFVPPVAVTPPPPFVPPVAAPDISIEEEANDEADAEWDDDAMQAWYDNLADEMRVEFEAQPVAALCRTLGIKPNLSPEPFGYPLCFGDSRGLKIGGDLREVCVVLNGAEGEWQLTTYGTSSEEWVVLHRWTLAQVGMPPSDVGKLVTEALRSLGARTDSAEQNAILAALLAWGAVTNRATDTLWAADAIAAHVDYEFPLNANHAAKMLVDSPFTSTEQVSELWRRFDPDNSLLL